MDEYHERLGGFPEEDEDANSGDDNNDSSRLSQIASNNMKGRGFRMEVINF